MKIKGITALSLLVAAVGLTAFKNINKEPVTTFSTIKEEVVTYTGDGITMKGFIAYDDKQQGVRPIVMIIPEWWGVTEYTKMRARKLADLGYLAMVVDMYGNGQVADNPTDAGKLSTPFYSNPQSAKARFDAALAKAETYSQADKSKVAGIGYCFGGAMVLNIARLGEDLKGVVSFHGNLVGVPPNKELLKAQLLICHGADDQFVKPAEVAEFKHQMELIGVPYTFKAYAGATHAFTNPDATAVGKKFNLPIAYNEAADKASWAEMKTFFNKIFAGAH